ncbi:MAG TPA: STAS domain-containing protein [Actinopolymorphaceae bacterium]
MSQPSCGSVSWRHVRLDDGRILVQVSGELVRVWNPTLRTALLEVVAESGSLLIDLRHVTRMDLTGVTMLVALRRHAFARGGEVRLVTPGDAVRDVLEATGVQYILPIVEGLPTQQKVLMPVPDHRYSGRSLVPNHRPS